TAGTGGEYCDAEVAGGLGVSFSSHGAGLLMQIADPSDGLTLPERVIQMHCAAARHHEDVPDSLRLDKLYDVIRKLHGKYLPRLSTFAGGENHFDQFSNRTLASASLEDHCGNRLDRRLCVGRRNAPPGNGKSRQIIDVIADECHA